MVISRLVDVHAKTVNVSRLASRGAAARLTLLPVDDFLFPAGRYELVLGGQNYDFAIAGPVTDPAQCVEGVATGRGPVFYECRTP